MYLFQENHIETGPGSIFRHFLYLFRSIVYLWPCTSIYQTAYQTSLALDFPTLEMGPASVQRSIDWSINHRHRFRLATLGPEPAQYTTAGHGQQRLDINDIIRKIPTVKRESLPSTRLECRMCPVFTEELSLICRLVGGSWDLFNSFVHRRIVIMGGGGGGVL